MTDRTELRRLAEVAKAKGMRVCAAPTLEFIDTVDPQTVLALLDAADRGDRAVELLRVVGRLTSERWTPEESKICDNIDVFLAEVDR